MKATIKGFFKDVVNSGILTNGRFWQLFILPVCLLALAGAANAAMDAVSFHFATSIFKNLDIQYWYPSLSWENKWEINDGVIVGEKFWGSSTIFVAFTDFWHLAKLIQINALLAAFTLFCCTALESNRLGYWIFFAVIKLIYLGMFNLCFSYLFVA